MAEEIYQYKLKADAAVSISSFLYVKSHI